MSIAEDYPKPLVDLWGRLLLPKKVGTPASWVRVLMRLRRPLGVWVDCAIACSALRITQQEERNPKENITIGSCVLRLVWSDTQSHFDRSVGLILVVCAVSCSSSA
ncbi:hypothetical protein ZHAS_00008561 [Anopheles sinensis]|uniref:Uncharacterized protein n=1 Tax=Anopheles sinensis TaxID=74873 RepID=A0A084VT09_ANOSI|nr:hypothetical protein ZHAS_00008561 [Anopheles sinensis]